MKTVVDDATTVDQYCVVVGMLAGGWSRMDMVLSLGRLREDGREWKKRDC